MRLNIGGQERRAGWTILDINPGPAVDMVGDVRDLSRLETGSCSEIYASHVLEHLSYRHELAPVLTELFRLLRLGGVLMVSVPDLETLSRLFIHPETAPPDRMAIMQMMFGGQEDAHDRHLTGFNFQILGTYLHQAGFREIDRVAGFGLFQDSSELRFAGIPVSCNMRAVKPV
jgi:predicted SAM-dependent methyltransferase